MGPSPPQSLNEQSFIAGPKKNEYKPYFISFSHFNELSSSLKACYEKSILVFLLIHYEKRGSTGSVHSFYFLITERKSEQ
jgi:hypothetical protein